VRIFGRQEAERREDIEYSLKSRWQSRGCIDLINAINERRERKGFIYNRPPLEPVKSTPPGRASQRKDDETVGETVGVTDSS
jgi:hypothetical protein